MALVAHTGSSSRNTSSYYVTHPTLVVDYEDEYQQDDVHTNFEDPLTSAMLLLAQAITQNFSTSTNNRLRTSSNTRNQAIIQGDRVNIQIRNSGNAGRNNKRAYVQEIVEGSNGPNETGNVQRTLRASSSGNTSTVQCYNYSGKGHYARNCPKPRVRDSKYFMEQMLLAKQDEAGVILTDEQNDFLFAGASRMEEIKELSANICLMARSPPADNTSDAGPSYDYAFISEKNRDKLDLVVTDYKRKNEELQKAHLILKRQMSENEDHYHYTILDLKAKLKKNVDLILKLGNFLQGMFMLGPKPLSVYDLQLKHGLGYPNPYTLKQAISQCLKLYLASSLSKSEIPLNVRDTEDTLDDASKSQQK
ncbi:retrovirus-related pol polyprotein from transposon TNT 1-94 [Tanacetum coccineum]